MKLSSQTTFLYFKELNGPAHFFEEILQLQKVDDQGFARTYKLSGGAFISIMDETKGRYYVPTEKKVLITLVAADVYPWYDRLKAAGIAIEAGPALQSSANIECFSFEGPGGYAFEIQTFLHPDMVMYF